MWKKLIFLLHQNSSKPGIVIRDPGSSRGTNSHRLSRPVPEFFRASRPEKIFLRSSRPVPEDFGGVPSRSRSRDRPVTLIFKKFWKEFTVKIIQNFVLCLILGQKARTKKNTEFFRNLLRPGFVPRKFGVVPSRPGRPGRISSRPESIPNDDHCS